MRVLLDTNIIIHREQVHVNNEDIGILFNWLDKLHFEKIIDPITIGEIENFHDKEIVKSIKLKINQYHCLKTRAPYHELLQKISNELDKDKNDKNDTLLLNELFNNRVDLLITEDRKIHRKAERLGINDRVFKIDSFLEKVTTEHPELVNYKSLFVKKTLFGNIDLSDSFFDSFRSSYIGFDKWYNSKADNEAYVCYQDNSVVAFLYLKTEEKDEPYNDITPQFASKKRLKIGTFKVALNGNKLGERFLKIIFDNAITQKVDEIYVTLFNDTPEQNRLVELLEDWGFVIWGEKNSKYGKEVVLIRDFTKKYDELNPRLSFPYFNKKNRAFFIPIRPEYHTSLLPDSIVRGESPLDYIEPEPFRNALAKVYVCRSMFRDLKKGDIIIFYRTGGYHHSVITTIGIVESVIDNLRDSKELVTACSKRSVFNEKELIDIWNYNKFTKPFVVNFLYAYSFPVRLNMAKLIELGIIKDVQSAPRGFEPITLNNFESILHETKTNESIIVD